MLFPNNIGASMSLDETSLSNGEVYTILTNKDAQGKKCCLAAMIKGVASEKVSEIIKLIPLSLRCKVLNITTDLSSSMMLIVRNSFPKAKLINDRFHVQQLLTQAIDQLRIRYRWEVLDEENRAIKEYNTRRKASKTKEEKKLLPNWQPMIMENGETKAQIMARSRFIMRMHSTKWNAQQSKRAEILFKMYPRLKQAYNIYLELVDIFNKRSTPDVARLNLAKWYNSVINFKEKSFNKVVETFKNHNRTIINYFEDRLTNASAESFNAKIKALRSQFRGVGDVKFFMYRLAKLYA